MWESGFYVLFTLFFNVLEFAFSHLYDLFVILFREILFLMWVPLESVLGQLSGYCEFIVFCHLQLASGAV